MRRPVQLEFTTHGGRRRGAGRKAGDKVSHAARPVFDKPMPAHVVLSVGNDVPNMRSSRRFRAIRGCFAAARGRLGIRLIEFSVLSNHLHFVVEADCSRSLARGMKGLSVRLARVLSRERGLPGRVFVDHYHLHLLRGPTELVNSIKYVQENGNRHYGFAGPDECSSVAHNAWEVLAQPLGWLLSLGWRRGRRNESIEMLAGVRTRPQSGPFSN